VYIREGISDLHIYVAVPSPYPRDRDVTHNGSKKLCNVYGSTMLYSILFHSFTHFREGVGVNLNRDHVKNSYWVDQKKRKKKKILFQY